VDGNRIVVASSREGHVVDVRRTVDLHNEGHTPSRSLLEDTVHHEHPCNGREHIPHDIHDVLRVPVVVVAYTDCAKEASLFHPARLGTTEDEGGEGSPRSIEDGSEVRHCGVVYIPSHEDLVNHTTTMVEVDCESLT